MNANEPIAKPKTNAVSKVLYRIAGIDIESIEESPSVDRVYAHHLGIALIFTFIVVFLISFYSFSYIGGRTIEFDVQSNSFTYSSNMGWVVYAASALIASVVAMIITLFDRMLFMSDWFYSRPFGLSNGFSFTDSISHYTMMMIRITIRILMSLAVAYALSIFLELKVFESEVMRTMQTRHLNDNSEIYEELKHYKQSQYITHANLVSELNTLQEQYNFTLKNDMSVIANNKDISNIDQKIAQSNAELTETIREIKAEYQDELNDLRTKLEQYNSQILSIKNQIEVYSKKRDAERTGFNPEGLSGISGVPDCGRRCRYWQDQIATAMDKLNEYVSHQKAYIENIDQITNEINDRVSSATINLRQVIDGLTTNREEVINSLRGKLGLNADQREKILAATKERIQTLKARISEEEEMIQERYQNEKARLFSSMNYKPLTDGPLSRLTALNALKYPSKYTKESSTIVYFSFWVKAFVIFLEIVPVLSKMFFSPPTGYSTIVQGKVAVVSVRIQHSYESEVADIEKEIHRTRTNRKFANHIHNTLDDDLFDAAKPG